MTNDGLPAFLRAKTQEERLREIEGLSELAEHLAYGIWLTLRWPWALFHRHPESASFSELRQLGFNLLCVFTIVCQLILFAGIAAASIHQGWPAIPEEPVYLRFALAFLALTIVRIAVWFKVHVWNC